MGPQTNNIQPNLNNTILSGENIGVTPSYSPLKKNKNNLLKFIIPALVFGVILIVVLINMASKKKIDMGSGKKEDYVQFMKLYQNGDLNSKKDINLNIPLSQTSAFKNLVGGSDIDQTQKYGEMLYSSFRKYGNDPVLNGYLILYKKYTVLPRQVVSIQDKYLKEGDESAKNLITEYLSDFNVISDERQKEEVEIIKGVFESSLDYYVQLNKIGCVKNSQLDYDCETKTRRNSELYPEVINALNKQIDYRTQQATRQQESLTYSYNLFKEFYKIIDKIKEPKK